MSRFDIDLTEVSTERMICPQGTYPARIAKAAVRSGTKDDRNWAMLNLTFALKDEEVSKVLGIDEPKVFYTVSLSFDKETEKLSPNNPDLGNLLEVVGLKNKGDVFKEGTDEATSQWDYNMIYFKNVADALSGYDILCNVVHRKAYNDPDRMEAVVNKVAKLD